MKLLEERILKDGVIKPGQIVKIDNFLNHQVDPALCKEIALEMVRLFQDKEINKVLTIEASGISMATLVALELGCPMVFAKKAMSNNISEDVFHTTVFSYTKAEDKNVIVSKEFLGPEDKVLIVDDFLAMGNALKGLIDLCNQAGAQVVGAAIAVEKAFQPGGKELRDKGYTIHSLARIASIEDDTISFVE
ncbi:MAG: xanthine phosphoribosyltransferase [Clostridia bacterium]|nr:xanthine phosphoribosyltransferase [Clostridia bacterium]